VSLAAAALKGGRMGIKRFFGEDFAWQAGLGLFFPLYRELSALPIGSYRAGTGARVPAVNLGSRARRWYTNLGPEPKIRVGRILRGILGAPV
jgi:hypothetical protein